MMMGETKSDDVVAVTYRQTATNITIYYSANGPINPDRRDQIEEIVNTIRNIVPNQRVITTPAINHFVFMLRSVFEKDQRAGQEGLEDVHGFDGAMEFE